jgi:hypothetical protein
MTRSKLRRIFQALVATTPVTWVACGHSGTSTTDQPDATVTSEGGSSGEASTDANDGSQPFDDTDATVYWCEAGPPQLAREAGCYNYFYVPCGLPPDTYLQNNVPDASGALNRCDQICIDNVSRFDCALLDPKMAGQAQLLDGSSSAPSDGGDEAATDDGGAPQMGVVLPGSYVVCGCPAIGRRPRGLCSAPLRAPRRARGSDRDRLGGHFAAIAFLEAASVPAFRRLHDELRMFSAPRSLLASVDRAVRDEERHARVMGRLARRFGGDVATPRVRRSAARSLEAVAIENAVEGCVRETYGALVATWQATHATDPAVRRAMRGIAADETRHASLAFRVARFLDTRLDARARTRVERARTRAIARLRDEVARDVPSAELAGLAGVPDAVVAERLVTSLASALFA